MEFLENIIKEAIKTRIKDPGDLAKVKRRISKKYCLSCPGNMALLKIYHEMIKKRKIKKSQLLEVLLRKRPVRSLSGIVNVSLLSKPYPCPGKCLYCPQEKGLPKSYLSGEPAVERAKKLRYNPFSQVKKRIEMLAAEGHPTDKIELRVVGGTWSFYPRKYQEWFVKRCFEAANEKNSKTLEEAQKLNEKAKHRIVGFSIETRPDFINEKEIIHLRKLGTTMVEMGIQSTYDDVLNFNLRGHKTKDTIKATKLLKDAGFKVLYQMMPNLPGSNLKKDEKMFSDIFSNPDFKPDLLKIYSCAILKEAPLYKLWKKKKYRPYSRKKLVELIKSAKKKVPFYVRIQRISRDIPSFLIPAGPAKISNLRQLLAEEMKKENKQCKCIRCREVKEKYDPKERLFIFKKEYKASEGKEIFLSFESKDRKKLYSLLRLRKTSDGLAIIRDLHTFGQLTQINNKDKSNHPQHKGLGKKLMKEAEKIAKSEFKTNEIAVISGVGVRGYYKKLGYKLKDTYMVKTLT
ncbi:MAG: tRNA uridine(34) 5-carboxymethylaminomethyl modification radical SAM/GNAT enzyme Elp3 [Candidatus Nealsonbacteria bacterium]